MKVAGYFPGTRFVSDFFFLQIDANLALDIYKILIQITIKYYEKKLPVIHFNVVHICIRENYTGS